MWELEKYIPQPPKNEWDRKLNLNLFSEGKKTKKWPEYTLVYWKDIEWTAYDKPGVRSYNMDVVDLYWNKKYTWERRSYTYQVPSENYGKPPLERTSNSTSIIKSQPNLNDSFSWFWFDTTSLENFRSSVEGLKSYLIQNFGVKSPEYIEFEKSVIFTLADMQRVWSGDGNYNKDIIPTAWKVGNLQALKNSLKQLWKPIPSDETMYNQWSLGNNPEKVICRDFAIVSGRIAKSLGFEAVAWTIEVWVSHAFTTVRSKETGEYYGISADAVWGPAKVFQWHSLAEIRESYGKHLISLGRAQHFGWVFLDDTGKVIGKWQSDIEKRRAKDFLWGDTPSRLLSQSLGTDVSLNKGNIGWIDYTNVIAQKWLSIEGTMIDTDLFFRWWLTRMVYGEGGATAADVGIGMKVSGKPIEISNGFTARAYVAADINMSLWNSSEKWTQAPYLSGNSVIWGQIKYEDSKWILTTDLGKSYELSGPNQMQRPLIKLLPSWEYAIFSGEYKWESMNILGKAVVENYYATQRRELSFGIRTKSWYEGALYQRNDSLKVPWFPAERNQETWIWVTWPVNKGTRWKIEASRRNGPQWSSTWVNAGIEVKF